MILHTLCPHSLSFSNQIRCGPSLLSAASASGLPAGGRDTGSSWTGQGDKAPQLQQPQSAPQPDATEEDCRQTLNSGWMRPWARHLLDFVGSLDRYQAEKAQEQDEHGTVLCQLHRKQSGLTEIKLILQIRNIFRTRFFAYCLCTTQQHSARATVAFLVLIQWKCHTFEP